MNKRKIGVVIDSNFNVVEAKKFFPDLDVVFLQVIIEDRAFLESEVSSESLLEMMKNKQKIKTSQPNPNLFLKAFQRQFALGYKSIVCFTLSKELSGTYNSAHVAKKMLNNENITIVNTKTAGPGSDYILANFHYYLNNSELDYMIILDKIVKQYQEGFTYFYVDNLKYLVNQGRINKFTSFIGNLFKIKPILALNPDGHIMIKKKIRIINNMVNYFINRVKEYKELYLDIEIYISYVNKTTYVEELFNKLKVFTNQQVKIKFYLVCNAIGITLGPGAFGVFVGKKIGTIST